MFRRIQYGIPVLAGIISISAACTVLIGWIFNIPILTSGSSGYITIKFNAAICFLLLGIALLGSNRKNTAFSYLNFISAGIVALIAIVTLSQYFFVYDIGIDNLFWKHPAEPGIHNFPGRMTMVTAFCFVVLSVVLLLLPKPKYHLFIQGGAFIILVMSIMTLTEYYFVNDVSNLFPMPIGLHAAMILFILSLGIFSMPKLNSTKLHLQRKLIIGIGLILSFMIAGFHITQKANTDSIETAQRIEHTKEVLLESEQVLSLAKDVITGSRGFVITGNEEFLEPFNNASAIIRYRIMKMKELTIDNVSQQTRIDSLLLLTAELISFEEQIIDFVRVEESTQAAELIASGAGKSIMDKIRQITLDLQHEENGLLRLRKGVNKTSINTAGRTSLLFQFSIIIILVVLYLVIFHNNRQRNKAEAELKESKEWFSTILSSIGDAVIATNNQGIITFINPVAQRLTGWSEEGYGMPLEKVFFIINEHSRQPAENPVAKVLQEGKTVGLANHTILIRKDKTEVEIDDSAAPILDANGIIQGVVLVFRDVAEQKQAQKELKEVSDKVFDLYNHAPCGYHSLDSNGLFVEINETELSWLGYTRDEVVEKLKFPDILTAASKEKFKVTFPEFIKKGYVSNVEFDIVRKDGTILPVIINASIIRDDDGNFVRTRSTVIDDTERKNNMEAVRILNEELQNKVFQLMQSNKELEAFSYSVSHDLRAPLRSINGYARILEEDYGNKIDPEGNRVMGVIMKNAKNMGQLIDDLLAFSRLGRLELTKVDFNMDRLVRSIVQERSGPDIDHITITVNNLPPAKGDVSMIKQVWVNLISNAIKYSGKKEMPIIQIGSAVGERGCYYYIKDNGVGFDMNYYNKLFGVFQRLHKSEDFEGTGVGLAIVQRIISKHGGQIWAEASINAGATFYFTLSD